MQGVNLGLQANTGEFDNMREQQDSKPQPQPETLNFKQILNPKYILKP